MPIADNLAIISQKIAHSGCKLIAVSKTQPVAAIQEAFNAGQIYFGENKAQEMAEKYDKLPHDIEWHMIGHLQTNKVKYIAPFVQTIQSVDSLKLLQEINRQAEKWNRLIDVMLQISIADEETKYGMTYDEVFALMQSVESTEYDPLKFVRFKGVMGIATNTDDQEKLRQEFRNLKGVYLKLKENFFVADDEFSEISMGMSGDYELAIEEGSTMIRVGSAIFGSRQK